MKPTRSPQRSQRSRRNLFRARAALSAVIVIVGVAAACVVSAQSPPASATVTIAGKTLSVRYSSPAVRGRKIFGDGGLLSRDPTYPAWRAGANSATTLDRKSVV